MYIYTHFVCENGCRFPSILNANLHLSLLHTWYIHVYAFGYIYIYVCNMYKYSYILYVRAHSTGVGSSHRRKPTQH